MKEILVECLAGFVIAFFFYLGWCYADTHISQPSNITLIDYYSIRNGQINNRETILKVKAGDIILGKFAAEITRAGTNSLERMIVQNDTEYVIEYQKREIEPNTKALILVTYTIPEFIEGCGYVITRSSYTYNYNLISTLNPVSIYSPPISFCVEKPKNG